MSILVVTNVAESGKAILETLQPLFVSIKQVNGYEPALKLIAAEPQDIDLVVLDMGIDPDDGLETLMVIQEQQLLPNISIIAFSNTPAPSLVADAIRFGACQFLATPINSKDLLERVKRELRLPVET